MHQQHLFAPYGLIVFGALYVAKPDVFFALISRRDASGQPREMPEQNRRFMRGLGLVFVALGFVLLVRSSF